MKTRLVPNALSNQSVSRAPLHSNHFSDAFSSSHLTSDVTLLGHRLQISHARLTCGTGPLFDFTAPDCLSNMDGLNIFTTVSSVSFYNTTSGSSEEHQHASSLSAHIQRILGCQALHCTNHLSGTVCNDMNMGGNLQTINSTFAHCWTTNTQQHNYLHQHSTTHLTHFSYSHLFQFCTFQSCSTTSSGGAINSNFVQAFLDVMSCSFDSCSSESLGGAICFWASSDSPESFTLTSSSFVRCRTTSEKAWGGSVALIWAQQVSFSDSTFLHSQSTWGGAAFVTLRTSDESSSGLHNCLFQDCTAISIVSGEDSSEAQGGALWLQVGSDFALTSLHFRACSCRFGFGQDVYLSADFVPVQSQIVACDSTSDGPNRLGVTSRDDLDHLIPTPPHSANIVSFAVREHEHNTNMAEAVIRLDSLATGTVLAVVVNFAGVASDMSNAEQNAHRVLKFVFDSSDTSSCSVSSGAEGVLQLPLSQNRLIASSSSIEPALLLSVSCVPDERTVDARLTLEGKNLPAGFFTVTLHDNFSFEVEMRKEETHSRGHVLLKDIGEYSRWTEGATFGVIEMRTTDTNHVVTILNPFHFSVPPLARVLSVEVSPFLNEDMSEVRLTFVTANMNDSHDHIFQIVDEEDNEISVKLLSFSPEDSQTVTVSLERSEDAPTPLNQNVDAAAVLQYGRMYRVVSVAKNNQKIPHALSGVEFTTPPAPVHIQATELRKVNRTKSIVSVSGVGFVKGELYNVSVVGRRKYQNGTVSTPHELHIAMLGKNHTTATTIENVDHHLKSGYTYKVLEIRSPHSVGFVDTVSFDFDDSTNELVGYQPPAVVKVSAVTVASVVCLLLFVFTFILFGRTLSVRKAHRRSIRRIQNWKAERRSKQEAANEKKEEFHPPKIDTTEELISGYEEAEKREQVREEAKSEKRTENRRVDAIPLSGNADRLVTVDVDHTLFRALHEDKRILWKRETELQIAKGLAHMAKSDMTKEVFGVLSSHLVVFNFEKELFLQISRLDESCQERCWDTPDEARISMIDGKEFSHDSEAVAVFRLGIIIWEIETGEIPFSSTISEDAEDSPDFWTSFTQKVDILKVENMEIGRVIRRCFEREPGARPTLSEVVSALAAIEEETQREMDADSADWQ
ncbi:hypothetical protein BLNAU_11240 [Blattamonas nauphoetae]|uniref:Uncharacterized protein n=1 Tax=Blattamonas nauphoetae TaxID=2049346 RepID=A0ABQ9XQW2_9EUKA|nr:hypothetical protein BLNAU_11240 [Blattamonas nauphoetae]